jgi:hypothetical protein
VSVNVKMGENGEIAIEEVEQMDKQIWTQENCKLDLRVRLTTNIIDSDGGSSVSEQ